MIEDDAETVPYLNNVKITNSSAFIRFEVTNLQVDYDRIKDWLNVIKIWKDKGINEVYFMMHLPDKDESMRIVDYSREYFESRWDGKVRVKYAIFCLLVFNFKIEHLHQLIYYQMESLKI